ncbi:MAG: prepilin-type N-terminal cleavage/methylation domain-containing protein [Phycisphaerae bacterium]|nr:prepilin-type N-terminal cleavage/methylation domain-containing protein [Gemmatimonadaceae bacterium]
MTKTRPHAGFTLIELLIVVVIIGILVAVAIPKFSETRGKAYASSLKSDLKNLGTQQELYFYSNRTYSGSLVAVNMTSSPGVLLAITEASANGWSATTTHPSADPLVCAVFYGNAAPVAPATSAGAIKCQ